MDKIIKKIIAIIVYVFLMYISYNIFMSEQPLIKKSDTFLKKQENIIKFEQLVEESNTKNKDWGFHVPDESVLDISKTVLSCETAECHTVYPHKKNRQTRAFYNMHSFRISCLTCHLDKDDFKKVNLGWFDADANYKNNGIKIENARISPYRVIDDYETVLEKGIKDHDDFGKKNKLKISLRKDIMCKSCHKKKGSLLLNLAALGYKKEKIKELRTLDEATMYNRKDNWSYPDFL